MTTTIASGHARIGYRTAPITAALAITRQVLPTTCSGASWRRRSHRPPPKSAISVRVEAAAAPRQPQAGMSPRLRAVLTARVAGGRREKTIRRLLAGGVSDKAVLTDRSGLGGAGMRSA